MLHSMGNQTIKTVLSLRLSFVCSVIKSVVALHLTFTPNYQFQVFELFKKIQR